MLSHGSTLTQRKKFATLAGGCAPEASTLPPVTVSRISPLYVYVSYPFRVNNQCNSRQVLGDSSQKLGSTTIVFAR